MLVRSTMLFAALTLINGLSFAGDQDAPAPAEAPPAFAVWTSFGCSRSLHQVSTHADHRSALNAAAAARTKEEGFVFVMKNGAGWSDAFQALKVLRSNQTDEKIRRTDYEQACRSGWISVKAPADPVSPPVAESPTPVSRVESATTATRTLSVFEVIR